MRTLCDSCESAAAILFCAADEAALCKACDEKVHMCNKLASRHLRVGLADPSEVSRCDVCENAPAFFYCEIDGSSLCLQCDMIVHVGGKRMHKRYLLLRQRVEFPADEAINDKSETVRGQIQQPGRRTGEQQEKLRLSAVPHDDSNGEGQPKRGYKVIDLNMKPYTHILHGQASYNQVN